MRDGTAYTDRQPNTTRRRGARSHRRASQHRRHRANFDAYRAHKNNNAFLLTGSLDEYADWNFDTEAAGLDPTVLHAEDIARDERASRLTVPRIGTLATDKPDGVWRFMYCQTNNLSGADSKARKIPRMVDLINEFDVDGVLMCETGVNWGVGPSSNTLKSWFDPLMDREVRSTTAHNIHGPKISPSQRGGTGILLTHSLLEYAKGTTPDHRGLGRWSSWVLNHNPDHCTRLIVAYCPGRSKPEGVKTVYRQQLAYIQRHGLNKTPYQLFVDDLAAQLGKWRASGERLLLFIDANEHTLTGPIARRLRAEDINMHEVTNSVWPTTEGPNTHADGKQPIDGIYATSDLDVTNCLLLSFHESVGDHRSMIVELTTSSSIGKFQGNIVRPTSRRLTLRQPGAVKAYNEAVDRQFTIHRIPQRLQALLEEAKHYSGTPPPDFQQKCHTIHGQIGDIRRHAESGCRKIIKPALDFSPPIQYWYDRAHAYKQLLDIKTGHSKSHTDVSRAIRFAIRKKISNPRQLTAEQCRDGLAACKLRQKELKKSSWSLRKQFVGERIVAARKAGDSERERAIVDRLRAENSRNTWRRINRITKPQSGRACREVQRQTTGGIVSYTTKETVESTIQEEISSRFHLGHSAPIGRTLLGDDLQYLSDIDTAYRILNGDYEIPDYLDPATKLMLVEIGKLGRATLAGTSGACDITITGEDYTRYWDRINEYTSSSPSGIHIAHYKASAKCPRHAEIFATQMNLIIRSGIHPTRWGTALQVMLEKVAGICLVDKLRSIQLYEADLNWFMKFIFHDIAIEKLKEVDLLPEEHYSQKGSTAEDACFEKTLTLDISRQSRTPMALISVDAAQCYDRVHPTLMSLIWLGLTNHPQSVILLLHVLQQMKIHTRTGFGDSTTYFGGDEEAPLCGLGQGSKAAPASWMQLSSVIVNAYKNEGMSSSIRDPITGDITDSVGCLYVDDTDLYTMSYLLTTIALVCSFAQLSVDLWSDLLDTTGGAIKGSKSFCYLIAYICIQGNWEYARSQDIEQNLTLKTAQGTRTTLNRKEVNDAEKTLGVYHSPAGGHAAHLHYLHQKSERWLCRLKNGHLPSALIWMSYYHQLWPGLRYGLGTLTNSVAASSNCLRNFDFQLLPLLGVNRHIKTGWRTLHHAFGGIGLLSLPIEQHICRLNVLLQHYHMPTIVGKKLQCSLHLLQLQLGTHTNPLLLNYSTWGSLAPNSWVTCLWESLNCYPTTLRMHYKDIQFPRENDNTIMTFLDPFFTSADHRRSINRCRCFLNIIFLSDIACADGLSLEDNMIAGYPTPRSSTYDFPPECPTRQDWLEWALIWRRALRSNNSLEVPLGNWIQTSHIPWIWFYDSHTDTIHEVRASCETISAPGQQTERRLLLLNSGPPLHLPTHLPQSFWDTLTDFGGNWMWENMHLDTSDSVEWLLAALLHGSLLWVTDGSYDGQRAPDICGAGWVVLDTTTERRWACSFIEVSTSANSYRAELLGLYSIHIFIHALFTHFQLTSAPQIKLRCDNKGALRTSSRTTLRIRASSKCADILRAFRSLHQQLQAGIHYGHVSAHMDDILRWDQLTLEQQLNVQCDTLAKQAVSRVCRDFFSDQLSLLPTTDILPLEKCALMIDGTKVTADPSGPLRFQCSKITARNFLCTQCKWTPEQFDEVCWEMLDATLAGKTPGFRVWLAKQHSNFCASRVQMKRWFGEKDDRCPSCLITAERADHLCRCPNEERTQLLTDCTAELASWLDSNNNTHHELAYWIPQYIGCRGTVAFADLGPMSPSMMQIAKSQDVIGWRNFMEGRVSKHIIRLQRIHLLTSSSRLTVTSWMKQFISRVLHITHSQWLFRNFMLHDNNAGYLKLRERTSAAIQIDALSQVRPSAIPADSACLLEFDTERLLQADSDTQHYWIAAMEAAIIAKARPNSHTPVVPRQAWCSSSNVAAVIHRIRKDINRQPIPADWLRTPTSISNGRPLSPRNNHNSASCRIRPSPAAASASLGSNKKHKPD